MHRIWRHWAAGRESQLFSASAFPSPTLPYFHKHVSVKRSLPSIFLKLPAYLASVRPFTQTSYVDEPSQAAQPTQKEEDHDDVDDRPLPSNSLWTPLSSDTTSLPPEHHRTCDDRRIVAPSDHLTSTDDSGKQRLDSHDPAALRDHALQVPVDEKEFATSSGFWSLHNLEIDHPESTTEPLAPLPKVPRPTTGAHSRETLSEPRQHADSVLDHLWEARTRPGKIDLSRWETVRGERDRTYPTQLRTDQAQRTTAFRDSTLPRRLVKSFVREVYPHISATIGVSDTVAEQVLANSIFTPLVEDIEAVLNLLNWSWVVTALPSLRVKRLVHLSRSDSGQITPVIPQWLVLQLLRSDRIDSGDLVDLLDLIEEKQESWSVATSMMTLTVRLLRHARASNPPALVSIIELFVRMLDHFIRTSPGIKSLQFRAHWCNRILTLLALPTPNHPFRNVVVQQDAQLLLLRYMHEALPVVPLNREGYRALTKLQLMHEKTDADKKWTRVQADTWPPWERQHQMGLASPPRESPGSTSRSNMVLYRMREDGYSPHAFDIAAQILGGRDSDGSPTWQVRRLSAIIPSRVPWLGGRDSTEFDASPEIWTARITATRTIREAWMGLCAYESAVGAGPKSAAVYHAMFQRLWARTLPAPSDTGPLPGDGLENYPDPELPRDRVHVPEEPPSVAELYARMVDQDIKPSGIFLRDLLYWAPDLSRGLGCLKASSMEPHISTVLSNPAEHSAADVADCLRGLHEDMGPAYIGLLARPHALRSQPRPEFQADLNGRVSSGPAFALQVLQHARFPRPSVWKAYFKALTRHVSERDCWRISLRVAWVLICDSHATERRTFDFSVLPEVLFTAQRVQTWSGWSTEDSQYEPLEVAMKFFMESVSGAKNSWTGDCKTKWVRIMGRSRPNLRSVPTADMVQDMAFLMVATQHEGVFHDMMILLRWTCEHRVQLASVSSFTKRNLAAFRVYLEGQWATLDAEFVDLGINIKMAHQDQIKEAKELCHQLGGWASDDEVRKYLLSSRPIFKRIKTKLKAQAKGE